MQRPWGENVSGVLEKKQVSGVEPASQEGELGGGHVTPPTLVQLPSVPPTTCSTEDGTTGQILGLGSRHQHGVEGHGRNEIALTLH